MEKALVFWQSLLSPHLIPFLECLPKLVPEGVKLTIVVPEESQEYRTQMGWEKQRLSGFEHIVNPNGEVLSGLLSQSNTIHVFEGIRSFPLGWNAIKKVKKDSPIFVMSEAPDLRGSFRRVIRNLATFLIERRVRKKIDGIFFIGENAKQWYLNSGYSREKLFPFHYVVRSTDYSPASTQVRTGAECRFLFVGSFVELKGIGRLIDALDSIPQDEWSLSLIGNGPLKESLLKKIEKSSIKEKVRFLGVMKNSDLRALMSEFDFLILPSFYDGWGAVINEAIMEGVPVIVSDACGSCQLVKVNPRIGYVFSAKRNSELTNVLINSIENLDIFRGRAWEIKSWANQELSGQQTAKYFLSKVNIA